MFSVVTSTHNRRGGADGRYDIGISFNKGGSDVSIFGSSPILVSTAMKGRP